MLRNKSPANCGGNRRGRCRRGRVRRATTQRARDRSHRGCTLARRGQYEYKSVRRSSRLSSCCRPGQSYMHASAGRRAGTRPGGWGRGPPLFVDGANLLSPHEKRSCSCIMHDPSRVRVTSPLEPFAVGFAAVLRVDGYTARGITGQLQLMAHLSRWLANDRSETLAGEPQGLSIHQLRHLALA
jgi:hypothetical protein